MSNHPELNQIRVPCGNLQVLLNRNNKVLNEESKRRLCYMFHVSKHPKFHREEIYDNLGIGRKFFDT
jgi:hypothetical protein